MGLSWRAGPGSRPTQRRGDGVSTTRAQESVLWRGVMGALYGDDWREQLFVLEEERAVEPALAVEAPGGGGAQDAAEPSRNGEEARGEPRNGDGAGGGEQGSRDPAAASAFGAPAQGAAESPLVPYSEHGTPDADSGAATPVSLRRLLEQEYDPSKEDRATWQGRVMRAATPH